jgi:hypothetical protein
MTQSQPPSPPQSPPPILPYDTPAPPEPPRTGRAIVRILIACVVLGTGLVMLLASGVGLLTVLLTRDRDSFAWLGMFSLLLVALGLTLSGTMNIITAIQWLRRMPESQNPLLRVWQRINNFGRRG